MFFKKPQILVIGSGAWGTAIANLLAGNKKNKKDKVFLFSNDEATIAQINAKKTNEAFLPNIKLNANIQGVNSIADFIGEIDLIFVVVPSNVVKPVLQAIAKHKTKKNLGFVICTKGLESQTLQPLSTICKEVFPKQNCAILSGPNFAIEVAQKIPTITTIATPNKAFFKVVSEALNNDYFQTEYFSDPVTVQICGTLKNIIAIGCGIIDGFGFGQNAKAALISKGTKEIEILCKALKADININNAAGFGDIFLTCATTKSRNNSLGFAIAKGQKYSQIIADKTKTFEGAIASQSAKKLAKQLKIKLPLCETINKIIFSDLSQKEIKSLILQAILK